ncbi:hypothetical protein PS2_045450 [Malus domestica]
MKGSARGLSTNYIALTVYKASVQQIKPVQCWIINAMDKQSKSESYSQDTSMIIVYIMVSGRQDRSISMAHNSGGRPLQGPGPCQNGVLDRYKKTNTNASNLTQMMRKRR